MQNEFIDRQEKQELSARRKSGLALDQFHQLLMSSYSRMEDQALYKAKSHGRNRVEVLTEANDLIGS